MGSQLAYFILVGEGLYVVVLFFFTFLLLFDTILQHFYMFVYQPYILNLPFHFGATNSESTQIISCLSARPRHGNSRRSARGYGSLGRFAIQTAREAESPDREPTQRSHCKLGRRRSPRCLPRRVSHRYTKWPRAASLYPVPVSLRSG